MKNLYENFLKEDLPIKAKLTVINEQAFLNLLREIGYKTEWFDDVEEDKKELAILRRLSDEHTKHLTELFEANRKE